MWGARRAPITGSKEMFAGPDGRRSRRKESTLSRNLTRALRLGAATAAALAVSAPSALAACPSQAFSTVFSAWGDASLYALAPNGDFEAGATGWTLTTGATLVADNPTLIASQTGDTTSVQLASGGTATSPAICVSSGYPTSRMFAKTVLNTSKNGSTLQVEVLYTDATRGGQATKVLGTIPNVSRWDAARKMSLAQGQLNIKPDSSGNTYVRYRFTPLYGSTWRIDDLYVDPRYIK
jgi:hypothetical protein